MCFNHGWRIGNNVAAQLEVQRWGLIWVDARRSAVQYSSKLLHMEDSGLHPFTSGNHLRLFSLYTYVNHTIIQKRQVSTRFGLFPYRFEYYYKYIPFLKWVQVPVGSQWQLFISALVGTQLVSSTADIWTLNSHFLLWSTLTRFSYFSHQSV